METWSDQRFKKYHGQHEHLYASPSFLSTGGARSSRSAGRAWRKGRARRERHGPTGESNAASIARPVSEIHYRIEKYCALIFHLATERKVKSAIGRGDRLVIAIWMSLMNFTPRLCLHLSRFLPPMTRQRRSRTHTFDCELRPHFISERAGLSETGDR